MKTVTKAMATVKSGDLTDEEAPHGSFDIILSAQTQDRDGDILKSSEWMDLPDWIPLDVDHAMSVEKTIGSGKPFINENGDVQVKGTYASTDLAQSVRTLINEKHIRHVSVAFTNDSVRKKDNQPFRELLNGGFVNTPSNREAVIIDSKSFATAATKAASDNPDDGAMVQAVHDASVVLGADCVEPSDDDHSGAADGTNKSAGAEEATRKTVRTSIINAKSLKGSVEDLQDRIRAALRSAYSDLAGWPYPVATFLNDDGVSGTVVYELWDAGDGDVTLGREFTDDGSVVTLADELAQVATITTVEQIGPVVSVAEDADQDGTAGVASAKPVLRSVTVTGTSPSEGVTTPMTPEQFAENLGNLFRTMTSGQQLAGSPHNEVTAASEAAADAADTTAAADAAAVTEAAEGAATDAAGSESDVATENAANALLLGIDTVLASETSDSPTQ